MHVTSKPTSAQTCNFAKVFLPVPVQTGFTYEIPVDLMPKVAVGSRVEVPFGRRILSGIVVELLPRSDVARVKSIRKIYDTYLPEELFALTGWIASYYGCSFGEAAQAVLPPVLKRASRRRMVGVLRLKGPASEAQDTPKTLQRAPRQLDLLRRLRASGGRAGMALVIAEWGFSSTHVKGLLDKGLAELDTPANASRLEQMDPEVRTLTLEQQAAFDSILAALRSQTFRPVLLQGVTGSGKTELYLRAAQFALASGGGCIVLVPEIGLLPQAMARYQRIFGAKLTILHSRLTGAERFDIWRRIERGESRIVLGPRSAVFSPVRDLRLIIVDEEQDDSYKQEDKPRYHARNVALMRGKQENLTVLLGSATPSAESFHHARSGRYDHVILRCRVSGGGLPSIRFVDMRSSGRGLLAPYLVERLQANIDAGNQSILFLNKRGHARYVQCTACGWVARCRNCDISLTYHRVKSRLKCHYCGYATPSVARCPDCGAGLYLAGAGTQRVELDIASLFPGAAILRMDADTTAGRDGHRRVLERFSSGDYPILIGTQMVAKGHHFPNVSLVGVLFAEESLNYPDFRSAERTFRQLVQVAGRAGRGSDKGEVIVQTYTPDQGVFKHLISHDYDGFMSEELIVRQQLGYPPFSRLILASCIAAREVLVARVAERWAGEMRRMLSGRAVQILGPVQPVVARVKNRYREQILIKGNLGSTDKAALLDAFKRVAEDEAGGRSIDMRWDVDPEVFT
jgi:primosomal protein N' (replication factor Y)